MAKDLQSVIRNIQKGNILPVYLLQGDDQFLQQFIVRKIKFSFLNGDNGNTHILSPDEMGGKEIIAQLITTDLFSSRKLFVLRNPHQLRQPYRDELLHYCEHPVDSHCLVIIVEEFRDKRSMVKELKKRIEETIIQTPYKSNLKKWVYYFFKEQGVDADSAVVNTVLDVAGDSIYHIANEVDKICISLDSKERLTVEHVYQFSGWRRDFQRWELLIAIGNRNLPKALKIGISVITQNDTMLSLIYPLTSLFQELLFIKISPGTFKEPGGYIPLPPSIKKRLLQFAKYYTKQEIQKALGLLGDIDERIKSTTISDEAELTWFLFNVLGKNE